jgi:hypothetical protein
MQNEKVWTIVNAIVKEVLKPEDMDHVERILVRKFQEEGYAHDEIQRALDIVLSLVSRRIGLDSIHGTGRAIRVLTSRERLSMTDEAASWLLGRYYLGEILLGEMEDVIGKAVSGKTVLDISEIKDLARQVLKRSFRSASVKFN